MLALCLLASLTSADGAEATAQPRLRQVWGGRYIVEHGAFELLKINKQELSRPYIDKQGTNFYVGLRSERLEARALGTGELVWAKPNFGEVGAEMSEYDGDILVGSGTELVALDKYDGAEAWRMDLGGALSGPPEVFGRVAILPVRPNDFVAVDLDSQALMWRRKRPTPEKLTIRGQAGAYIDGARAIAVLGFSDGTLEAVELSSGEIRWLDRLAEPAELFQDIDTRPIPLADGSIVAAAYNKGVYRLGVDDGAPIWFRPLESVHGAVKPEGSDFVVMSTGDGRVVGMDPESGRVEWTYATKEGSLTRPSDAGNGQVWVGTFSGSLSLLDASTGRPLQLISPGAGVGMPPFVRGEDAVFLSHKALVLVLARGRGQFISATLPIDRQPGFAVVGGSGRSW